MIVAELNVALGLALVWLAVIVVVCVGVASWWVGYGCGQRDEARRMLREIRRRG